MFRGTESYEIVKSTLINMVPHVNILKAREEDNVLLVINNEYALFFLNDVGKDFLRLCDGKRTLKDILLVLYNEYDVAEDTLTDDIFDIIQTLQKKRILSFDITEQL